MADAVAAMPFLAERRVVVVRGCERLRAQPRRDLWAVAEAVPAGNTLMLEDLFPPNKKTKPEPFGALAGRKALRIDTTVTRRYARAVRSRNARAPRAKAEPRAIAVMAGSEADLGAIGNDLEKLALAGPKITLADLERESLAMEDPKAWQYAARWPKDARPRRSRSRSTVRERSARRGRTARERPRDGLGLVWELARPGGGDLPPRHRGASGRFACSRGGSANGARATATRPRCAASKRSSRGESTTRGP